MLLDDFRHRPQVGSQQAIVRRDGLGDAFLAQFRLGLVCELAPSRVTAESPFFDVELEYLVSK